MFDFVKRTAYEREREARIRAEADRDAMRDERDRWVERSGYLSDQLASERIARDQERDKHNEAMRDLLERFIPLQPATGAETETPTSSETGLEDLIRMPASGKTEIEAKRNAIELWRRSHAAQDKAAGIPDENELTPAERAVVASKIG